MVIKNFLFLVVSCLILSTLSGCRSIDRTRPQGPAKGGDPTSPPALPDLSEGEDLRSVGVYLGPGGMRSFAHIGVLKTLQRAKIPVVAIGGVEWGSLVAANFALTGKANSAEWQMMKLKKSQIPSAGFFSNDIRPKSVASLRDFLGLTLGSKRLHKGKHPFVCPATNGEEITFVRVGAAKQELVRCIILPPLFNLAKKGGSFWMSGAVTPHNWAQELQKAGAEYLIYVDVVSKGELVKKGQKHPQTKALWTAVKSISKANSKQAHLTIEVPTHRSILDFANRRELVSSGVRVSRAYLKEIKSAIGM